MLGLQIRMVRRSQACILCGGKTRERHRKRFRHGIEEDGESVHECENCGYGEEVNEFEEGR
mgnify:CR=1 FL=1